MRGRLRRARTGVKPRCGDGQGVIRSYFGKTTLLSDWTRTHPAHVAWVSLDEGDNDPARFWAYLVAALQTIHAGVGGELLAAAQSGQRPPTLKNLVSLPRGERLLTEVPT